MSPRRDVAVVLSGGAVNGVLLELGFLQRLRASELWPRVGWIFGTSAGALSGTMAALDRLDEFERFMLRLQPEDTFMPHKLWRLPLLGTHSYRLPQTAAERLGKPLEELAAELAEGPIELVVCATDVSAEVGQAGPHAYELVYSSKRTPPEEMAQAILASAAISALVLPRRVGDRIATDGAWVRNYPLGHAYERDAALIVAFRYLPTYPRISAEWMTRLRRRLERFRRVPPVRALIDELREGEEREERGEPAHWGDMIIRLMRVAVMQNTLLEERSAGQRDESIRELRSLREDVLALVGEGDLGRAVEERFAEARFPFRHDRALPRITVQGAMAEGEVSLDAGLRKPRPWQADAKRELITRGYDLLDAELRAAGFA